MARIGILTCSNCTQKTNCGAVVCLCDMRKRRGFFERYKNDEELRVVGRITKNSSRFFEGTGELLLHDGSVAAEGLGKYLKTPLEKIADFDEDAQEWRVVPTPQDPREIIL